MKTSAICTTADGFQKICKTRTTWVSWWTGTDCSSNSWHDLMLWWIWQWAVKFFAFRVGHDAIFPNVKIFPFTRCRSVRKATQRTSTHSKSRIIKSTFPITSFRFICTLYVFLHCCAIFSLLHKYFHVTRHSTNAIFYSDKKTPPRFRFLSKFLVLSPFNWAGSLNFSKIFSESIVLKNWLRLVESSSRTVECTTQRKLKL